MAQFSGKTQEEIINDILVNIVTNVNEVTDVNVGSVLRMLVESLGLEVNDLYSQLQSVYDGTRIDTSTGTDLENLGALLGITRKQGTKSTGYVSFIRNTPAIADFTIPIGSIISTQPNTTETQLRFLVQSNTTFSASILNETHKFINGIYDYATNERFIDSLTDITGTVSGGGYTFVESTDFQLVEDFTGLIVNPDDVELLDSCDVVTSWNASAGAMAIAADLVDFKQGIGSLRIGKTTIVSDTVYYDKTLGGVHDGTGKDVFLWFYIKDTTVLNKIFKVKLAIGSGGSLANSYEGDFPNGSLSVGWNVIKFDFTSSGVTRTGFPNIVAANYLRITLVTNNVTDRKSVV